LILEGGNPKLWLLFGLVAGLGLLNKYSVGFLCIGLAGGLLLSWHRALFEKWLWLGAFVAGLVFLPHILWEFSQNFPSLEFMRNATENKNVSLGAVDFLLGQFRDMNFLNAPVWIAGIYFFFSRKNLRPLAWMYLIVFTVMVFTHAK